MKRKILTGFAILLVIIQFIRPTRNLNAGAMPNQITTKYAVPEDVLSILKTSCYDCHSNNTKYPWYTYVQPVGWWMQNHVNDGKRHLNFDEFASYSEKKASKKFEEIQDETTEGEMPLESYLIANSEAKLTAEQVKKVADWAEALK